MSRPCIAALTTSLFIAGIHSEAWTAEPASTPASPLALEEILVTASKRGETTAADTPIAISAFLGDELVRTGSKTLADFLQTSPGVGIVESRTGTNSIQIRGISSTGAGDATVGYYLDDLPFTLLGNSPLPDVRSFDLERVEVLRGPQGTLYGAGSEGGTIRIITRNPDVRRFETKANASYSDTQDGDTSYDVNAAVNVPLIEDRLAVRGVVSYSDFGGWLSDPVNDEEYVNDATIKTYRAKLLFQPSDATTLSGSAWLSRVDAGAPNAATSAGARPFGAREFNAAEYDLYNTVVRHDFGQMTVFNAASYIDYSTDINAHVSSIPGAFARTAIGVETFTNELRVSSEFDGAFNFLVGGFYADTTETIDLEIALGPATLPFQRDDLESRQWAVFGEAYYEFLGGRAELTLGLRYFHDERSTLDYLPNDIALFGLLGLSNPRDATFDSVDPRLNLALRLTQNTLVYFNAAHGFRSGALQPGTSLISAGLAGVLEQIPREIDPESLWSYEIGTKVTSLLDGKLDVEAAIFYNDWDEIISVLPLSGQPIAYALNGPAARTYGVELNAVARLAPGLTVTAGGVYNEAEFAESESIFNKGDRIANVPRVTASGSVDYVRPLGFNALNGFLRLDVQHNAKRTARSFVLTVPAVAVNAESDSITRLNARIGVSANRWSVALFGDNLLDEDGAVDPVDATTGFATRLRPTTIGINVDMRF
jgi:iron complex outermembrane receptor protein